MSNLEQFRVSARTWLEENCPPSMRTPMITDEIVWGGRNASFSNPDSRLWLERMGRKGWTCPTWPKEYGEVVSLSRKARCWQRNSGASMPDRP